MPSNRKENWLDTFRGVVHIGAPGCGREYTVCGLAFAFAWAWVYAGSETARKNRAIYRDKYPDYKGGDHL